MRELSYVLPSLFAAGLVLDWILHGALISFVRQVPWRGEHEAGDLGVEEVVVSSDHIIFTVHGAPWCADNCAARIFVALPRVQHGLLPNDPCATHFLRFTESVGDDPVPAQ